MHKKGEFKSRFDTTVLQVDSENQNIKTKTNAEHTKACYNHRNL